MLALLANAIDPWSEQAREMPIDPWIRVPAVERDSVQLWSEEAAFLYAVGATHQDPRSARLVAASFEPLHQALAHKRLAYRGWELIERLLPNLGHENWDNCERLRRSVLDLFASRNWDILQLLESINRRDVFRALLRSLNSVESARTYLRTNLTSDSISSGRLKRWKLKSLKKLANMATGWSGRKQ